MNTLAGLTDPDETAQIAAIRVLGGYMLEEVMENKIPVPSKSLHETLSKLIENKNEGGHIFLCSQLHSILSHLKCRNVPGNVYFHEITACIPRTLTIISDLNIATRCFSPPDR